MPSVREYIAQNNLAAADAVARSNAVPELVAIAIEENNLGSSFNAMPDEDKAWMVNERIVPALKKEFPQLFQVEVEPARTERKFSHYSVWGQPAYFPERTIPAKYRALQDPETEAVAAHFPERPPAELDESGFIEAIQGAHWLRDQQLIDQPTYQKWLDEGERRISQMRADNPQADNLPAASRGDTRRRSFREAAVEGIMAVPGMVANLNPTMGGQAANLRHRQQTGQSMGASIETAFTGGIDPLEQAVRAPQIESWRGIGSLASLLGLTAAGSGAVTGAMRGAPIAARLAGYAGADAVATAATARNLPGLSTEALGIDPESTEGQALTIAEGVGFGIVVNALFEGAAALRARRAISKLPRDEAIQKLSELSGQPADAIGQAVEQETQSALAQAVQEGQQFSTTRTQAGGGDALDDLLQIHAEVHDPQAALRRQAQDEFQARAAAGRERHFSEAQAQREAETEMTARARAERDWQRANYGEEIVPVDLDDVPLTQWDEADLIARAEAGDTAAMREFERRQYDAQSDAFDSQMELQDHIRDLGGIPTSKTLRTRQDPLAGDVALLEQGGNAGKRLALFRSSGKELDNLRETLAERGFTFETVDDMLQAVDRSLRGERVFPDYANMAGSPINGQWEVVDSDVAGVLRKYPKINLEMASAEEVSKWADDIRNFERNIEVEVFGEEGAKAYRRAEAITNSSFRSIADPKVQEAMQLMQEMERKLTPQQYDLLIGENLPHGYVDRDTARHFSNRLADIETAEDIDDLARSTSRLAQDVISNTRFGREISELDATLLSRIGQKAQQLGADEVDYLTAVLKERLHLAGRDAVELMGVTEDQAISLLRRSAKANRSATSSAAPAQLPSPTGATDQDLAGAPRGKGDKKHNATSISEVLQRAQDKGAGSTFNEAISILPIDNDVKAVFSQAAGRDLSQMDFLLAQNEAAKMLQQQRTGKFGTFISEEAISTLSNRLKHIRPEDIKPHRNAAGESLLDVDLGGGDAATFWIRNRSQEVSLRRLSSSKQQAANAERPRQNVRNAPARNRNAAEQGGNVNPDDIAPAPSGSGTPSPVPMSDKAKAFARDLFTRLKEADPRGAGVSIRVLDAADWRKLGPSVADRTAAYDFKKQTIYFRRGSAAMQGDNVVNYLVHEAGHFAHDMVLGDDFVKTQWGQLTPVQRQQAWQAYTGQSAPVEDSLLLNNPAARREWAAYQFARVVRGESQQMIAEGMDRTFVERLQEWLEEVRSLVRDFIGDPSLGTAELDKQILDRLAYGKPDRAPGLSARRAEGQTGELRQRGSFRSQVDGEHLSPEVRAQTATTGSQYYAPISNDVTLAEAAAIIDRDGAAKTRGRVLSPRSDLAPRQRAVLMEALVQDADRAYQSALRSGDARLAQQRLDEFIEMEASYMLFGTELAQGLQAFRLKGLNLIPEKWVRQANKIIEEARQSTGKNIPPLSPEAEATIRQKTEAMRNIPEGFQRHEAMEDLRRFILRQVPPSKSDIFISLAYANMLSGHQTQLLNATATAAQGLSDLTAQSLVHPSATAIMWRGYLSGLKKGADEARAVLATGANYKGRFAKYSDDLPTLEYHTLMGGYWNPLNYAKYVGRLMAANDMIFYKASEEARGRVLAVDLATSEGLKGAALSKRVHEILGTNKQAIEAAQEQARREGLTGHRARRRVAELAEQQRPEDIQSAAHEWGLRATFNNEPEGALGELARAASKFTNKYKAAKLIVPFTRVVANVTNRMLDYSPWGLARAGMIMRKEGLTEMAKQHLAETFLGGTAMAFIGWQAMRYLDDPDPWFSITGQGPGDPNRLYQLQESGYKPYSIKIGNRYIAYKETNMGVALSLVGNYLDAIRFRGLDEESAGKRLGYAMSQVPRVIVDQSFLTGTRDFFQALSSDSVDPSKPFGWKTARTMAGLAIPNAIKQIDRIFDPTIYTDDNITELLLRDVPVVRSLAGKPILNALGEPVNSRWTPGQAALSRFGSVETGDPLWSLIAETQAWLPDYRASATLMTPDGGIRDMTNDEYYRYAGRRGGITKDLLTDMLPTLKSLQAEGQIDAIDQIIKRVSRSAGEQAKQELTLDSWK